MMLLLQGIALEALKGEFIPHCPLLGHPSGFSAEHEREKHQIAPLRFKLPYEKLAV